MGYALACCLELTPIIAYCFPKTVIDGTFAIMLPVIQRTKGQKRHLHLNSLKQVGSIRGKRIHSSGCKAAQPIFRIDGPNTEFETVLVYHGGHILGKEPAIHTDPI